MGDFRVLDHSSSSFQSRFETSARNLLLSAVLGVSEMEWRASPEPPSGLLWYLELTLHLLRAARVSQFYEFKDGLINT